jgi:arylformamidase
MAAIDYEAEYNNRARVPEHPEIFARWIRDAEFFRADTLKQGRAELGLFYGDTPRQYLDLFHAQAGAAAPLALFIHGGYWRSLEPALFTHMARGLNAHGISVAVVGYDLCPTVRIADIIAQVRQACLYLWRRFGQRIMVYGHSAGGHLAACMLATEWKAVSSDMPADLVPAASAISGVFDLDPLVSISMNADLRLEPVEARLVSPLYWTPPVGRTLDLVVGALESNEFLRQSRAMADGWADKGVRTRYDAVAATNHFTVIDALADSNDAMVTRLRALAGLTRPSA